MKAVIYARYSSDNQREESIEGQLRECRAFAEKNDIQIVGTYIDRAYSAKTDNRPEFQQMIKESSGRTFDIILVWKLDRFARNRYDSAHYKAMLRRNGVRVVSATESISEGAEGILLESVLEGMAEYYSAELAEKVNRGMTENALKCKFNGGTPPLGYVIDKDQFYQIDPITAPIVLEAFQRYASGASMREVVDEMNLKGIRTNRGGKMNINRVTGMLHNRRYIGEFRYRDIVQPGGIPAIVPEELFNQVQERMAANKKAPARHKAEEEYLLTTKLFCGKCQCYMAGESGTGKNGTTHRYYKCVSVKHHRGCDKKSVRKGWIENAVIFMARKIIFDDDLIEDVAQTVEEELNTESTALAALRAQYDATQKSLDNLLLAIEQGILTPTTKHRMEQLEEEKKELSAQIAKEELSKPKLTKNQIIFWFHRLRKLDMSKVEHRRRLIDSFINAVFLFEDHMVFVFNFKGGTATVTFEELEAAGFGSAFSGSAVPGENPVEESWQDFRLFFIDNYTKLCTIGSVERRLRMNPHTTAERELSGAGYQFKRAGKKHDIWFHPELKTIIPLKRHDFNENDLNYIQKEIRQQKDRHGKEDRG